MNSSIEEIAARIRRAKSVVILTHMRPDGDAIGSALALSCALERLGIAHHVCCLLYTSRLVEKTRQSVRFRHLHQSVLALF